MNSQLKNLWVVGVNADVRPEAHDFYEPRISGKMLKLHIMDEWVLHFYQQGKKIFSKPGILSAPLPNIISWGVIFILKQLSFNNKLTVGLSGSLGLYDRDFGFATLPIPIVPFWIERSQNSGEYPGYKI
jgi:hypothetical protein